jgi:hypothetical protein
MTRSIRNPPNLWQVENEMASWTLVLSEDD